VLATLPAVVIGLAIKDFVEAAMGNTTEVLIELFLTGVLLFVAEGIARSRTGRWPGHLEKIALTWVARPWRSCPASPVLVQRSPAPWRGGVPDERQVGFRS